MSKETHQTWTNKGLAVPLPFFYGILFWAFKGRYGCYCGKGFWRYESYQRHYRMFHIEEE